MSERTSVRLDYPNGYHIYAWLDEHEGKPHIKVHWRNPDGKPVHQPFYVDVPDAKNVFSMLASFAASVECIEHPDRD